MPYEQHTNSRLFGRVRVTEGQRTSEQETMRSSKQKGQMVDISRTLIAFPFLMNELGVVTQNLTAAALVRVGFTEESVPFLVQAGRAVQLDGDLALASGKFSKAAAALLTTFLIGATIIGHPFWKAPDQKSRTQDKAATFVSLGLLGPCSTFLLFTGKQNKPTSCFKAAPRIRRLSGPPSSWSHYWFRSSCLQANHNLSTSS